MTLRRYYLLVFIDIGSRAVFFGGITTNPTGARTTQAARNLHLRHHRLFAGTRAVVRDRGSQFIDAFDQVFRSQDIKILKCPVRTPIANAYAERWIGTLRRELFDRTIVWNQQQLERLVIDYIDHYKPTDPTAPSNKDPQRHPNRPPRPPRRGSLTSPGRPAATDSSTNTETPHEQPRHHFRHPQAVNLAFQHQDLMAKSEDLGVTLVAAHQQQSDTRDQQPEQVRKDR